MAAPHQNIADIVVLKAAAAEPDHGDLYLDGDAPVGLKLAAMRKAKGLSHADVHAGTKIKIVHIAAIEAGDRADLPATPFTAGFVKAYAQFLGLDADAFARAYKEEAGFTPIAAPVRDAIIAAQKTNSEQPTRSTIETALTAAPAAEIAQAAMGTTALVPLPAPAPTIESAIPAPASASRPGEPDKMVTWLGAGAVIAVVAFLAGRAAQPQQVTSEIAPPAATVIAAAPAEVTAPVARVVPEIAPPAAEIAPPIAEPVDAAPIVEVIKPPVVKPQPKKRIAQEAPTAPAEETPAPVIVMAPAAPIVVETAPATMPEPTIIAAKMTSAATPEYPERCAMRAGERVGVTLVFSITTDGRPVSASVIASDDRCFNSAAQRAVYDMRFSPRTVDGVPAIETGKAITVQFVR